MRLRYSRKCNLSWKDLCAGCTSSVCFVQPAVHDRILECQPSMTLPAHMFTANNDVTFCVLVVVLFTFSVRSFFKVARQQHAGDSPAGPLRTSWGTRRTVSRGCYQRGACPDLFLAVSLVRHRPTLARTANQLWVGPQACGVILLVGCASIQMLVNHIWSVVWTCCATSGRIPYPSFPLWLAAEGSSVCSISLSRPLCIDIKVFARGFRTTGPAPRIPSTHNCCRPQISEESYFRLTAQHQRELKLWSKVCRKVSLPSTNKCLSHAKPHILPLTMPPKRLTLWNTKEPFRQQLGDTPGGHLRPSWVAHLPVSVGKSGRDVKFPYTRACFLLNHSSFHEPTRVCQDSDPISS